MIALDSNRYHALKFQPNPKYHDEGMIFPDFACAACLLLAARLLACLLACVLLLLSLVGPT